MSQSVVVAIGDSGSGKTTFLNTMFDLQGIVGESARKVTAKQEEFEVSGCRVIDCVGGDTSVIAPYLRPEDKAIILVFVTGRYLDRYDAWKEKLKRFEPLLMCVRAHNVAKGDEESIGVQDVLKNGLDWLKNKVKSVGVESKENKSASGSPKKRGPKKSGQNSKCLLSIQVAERTLANFDKAWTSIKFDKNEIDELRAIGDALLLLTLRVKKVDDTFKQNSHLCEYLLRFPNVHTTLKQVLGEDANEERLGDGLEAMFAWSITKTTTQKKTKRVVGSFLLQEYISWAKSQ